MKYLYIDNFRGFRKTYIPIKDINFLVGENSTGKTSILGLIKKLSPQFFLTDISFNIDDLNIRLFDDVVNKKLPDSNYFSIGMIKLDIKTNKVTHAFLMTFIEKQDGVSGIYRYTHFYRKKGIDIIYDEENWYKKFDNIISYNLDEFKEKVYNIWQIDHINKNIDYTEYKSLPSNTLIVGISQWLYDEIINEDINYQILLDNNLNFANVVWMAPIRTKPKRTYDEFIFQYSSEGEHIPYLLKKIYNDKDKAKDFKKILNKFGRQSGMFDSIKVKKFGNAVNSPFEIQVVLNNMTINIINVGYGVSQSLPILIEFIARPKDTSFVIQQPELHFHPKAQAALGNFIYNLFKTEGKKFFIETHSDFIIDRFRYNLRSKDSKNPKAQVLFFERVKDGNSVYPIEILENGEMSEDQPTKYQDFFIQEAIQGLGI
jgi:predicted ATPase